MKSESRQSREPSSNNEPSVALYVVLAGTKLRVDDVRRRSLALREVSASGSRLTLRLGNAEAPVYGYDGNLRQVERIWFRLDAPDEEYAKAIGTIAHTLGWEATTRWGRIHGVDMLPPDPGALLQKKAQMGSPSTVRYFFPAIVSLFLLQIFWSMVQTPRITPGDRAVFVVCLLAIVASWARFLYSSFRRERFGALDGLGLLACLLIDIWYEFPSVVFAIAAVAYAIVVPACVVWYICARRRHDDNAALAIELTTHKLVQARLLGMTLRDRIKEERCIACDYDLRLMDSCRCPECGTLNYYLFDREDAQNLAREHGAVF